MTKQVYLQAEMTADEKGLLAAAAVNYGKRTIGRPGGLEAWTKQMLIPLALAELKLDSYKDWLAMRRRE